MVLRSGAGVTRIAAAIVGDLRKYMADEIKNAETATMGGMKAAVDGLKGELRQQVVSAGLSQRLANTWRGRVYPEHGKSLEPAGFVWSKAPDIIRSFDEGLTIVPVNGAKYLAIPTENTPPRRRGGGFGSKGTFANPFEVETIFNQDLKFFRGKNGTVLAYVMAITSKSGKGFRAPTKGRVHQGRKAEPIIMFVLVPSAKMPKLLDVQAAGEKWQGAVAGLVLDAWPDK